MFKNCTSFWKVYTLSVSGDRLIVGTAGRRVLVWDLRNMGYVQQRRESSLKYQTRCIRAFPNKQVWEKSQRLYFWWVCFRKNSGLYFKLPASFSHFKIFLDCEIWGPSLEKVNDVETPCSRLTLFMNGIVLELLPLTHQHIVFTFSQFVSIFFFLIYKSSLCISAS